MALPYSIAKLAPADRRFLEETFWSNVVKSTADRCWIWSAKKIGRGYGWFCCFQKMWLAHHLALALTGVAIPETDPNGSKILVLHICDNPSCVNATHLFLGTHTDNMRDMRDKGRLIVPRLKGENHGSAKLNDEIVRQIRRRRAKGEKVADLAKEYHVAQARISEIANRKAWTHVID